MRIVAALGRTTIARCPRGATEDTWAQTARSAQALASLACAHALMIVCPGDLRASRRDGVAWWAAIALTESLRRAAPALEVAPIVLRPVVAESGPGTCEPGGFMPLSATSSMLDQGICVVGLVCGDEPATLDTEGRPQQAEGRVADDDAAAAIAIAVDADALLLLTDVDAVYRGFGTDRAAPVRRLSVGEADALVRDGSVDPDSMAPKLRAASRFARHGGFAAITATGQAEAAMRRTAGTRVHADTAAPSRNADTIAPAVPG